MNLSELRTALQERREDYSASDSKLNRKINQAYLDICSRRKWGWLRREHAVTTEGPVTITGTAAQNITVAEGSKTIAITAALVPAGNASMLGKRIIIGGEFYEVVSLSPNGQTITIDRPYMGTAYPDATVTPTAYGSIQIMYDEYALPPGAHSIIESVLFESSTSSATSLNAVHPAMISRRDKAQTGTPTTCSVVEKRPIHTPRKTIGALTPGASASPPSASQLTPGATYKYWYTHWDLNVGAESALSEHVSITLSTTDDQVVIPDIVAKTDYVVRLYRSMANGDTPYLLNDPLSGTLGTFTDTTSDEYLMERGPESASTMFLRLHPTPSAHKTLHILYQSEAKAMSGDNERPLFDAEYASVLLDGAELLMLTSSDEQNRAALVQRNYESGIQRMIANDRLNFQQRVLIGREGRRLRGKPNSWYGSFPDYGNSGL